MTLRELVWMLKGRRIHDWGRTGSQIAMIANVNRNPKKHRAFQVADFVPSDLRREFRVHRGIRLTRQNLRTLKPLFAEAK